jgi:THO complex subunit 1
MEPQKGKALVLLRTLNELLRRLSKTAQTTFCGRILTFLSGAYSLGDRSGVNLRGEYGPMWDADQLQVANIVPMDVDSSQQQTESSKLLLVGQDQMAIDEKEPSSDAPRPEDETKDENDRKREGTLHENPSMHLTK